MFDGREVVKTEDQHSCVMGTYKSYLGTGINSTDQVLKKKHADVPNRNIRKIVSTSKKCQFNHLLFKNQVPLKTVHAKMCDERWQMDLMKGDEVYCKGKKYRYILSVNDVLSRNAFLRVLPAKSSKCAAKALHSVIAEHGTPGIIQYDQGPEFRGHVEKMLLRKKVTIIRSSPYHPQSQGRCKRSHREV